MGFELSPSQIAVQAPHKDAAIKEDILAFRVLVKGYLLCSAKFKSERAQQTQRGRIPERRPRLNERNTPVPQEP